jgi:protein transport protein SEC24
VRLPNTVHLSISCLEEEGIYVLDDGLLLYVYIGSNVSRDVMLETFGVERELDLDPAVATTHGMDCFLKETSLGSRALNVLNALRHWHRERHQSLPVVIVYSLSGWNNDLETMRNLLVDDPIGHEKSYVDFLCVLHKRIKSRVEEERRD